MSKLAPWRLLQNQDISPSPWFPLEKRTYELPSGKMLSAVSISAWILAKEKLSL